MVHMAVGQQYFFNLGAHLLDGCKNPVDVTAGIYDRGFACRLTLHYRTILLVGRDRHHRDGKCHLTSGFAPDAKAPESIS